MIQKTNPTLLLSFLLLHLCCTNAFAGKDDFKQTVEIDAGYQKADGINKTSVFIENVHITQGSLTINADEVEVLKGENEGEEIFIAKGQPATYSQKMDDGTTVQASALIIQYVSAIKTITLEGAAKLSQNGSEIEGGLIKFDIENETLEADGGNDGRVRTVFKPELLDQAEQPEKNN